MDQEKLASNSTVELTDLNYQSDHLNSNSNEKSTISFDSSNLSKSDQLSKTPDAPNQRTYDDILFENKSSSDSLNSAENKDSQSERLLSYYKSFEIVGNSNLTKRVNQGQRKVLFKRFMVGDQQIQFLLTFTLILLETTSSILQQKQSLIYLFVIDKVAVIIMFQLIFKICLKDPGIVPRSKKLDLLNLQLDIYNISDIWFTRKEIHDQIKKQPKILTLSGALEFHKHIDNLSINEKKLFLQIIEFYHKGDCTECNIKKFHRTKHCYYCNCCIEQQDHHCPWLNCCIGIRNHRQFIILCMLTNLQLLINIIDKIFINYNFWLIWIHDKNVKIDFIQIIKELFQQLLFVNLVLILEFIIFILMVILNVMQNKLILKNETCEEYQHKSYSKNKSLFNISKLFNVKLFQFSKLPVSMLHDKFF